MQIFNLDVRIVKTSEMHTKERTKDQLLNCAEIYNNFCLVLYACSSTRDQQTTKNQTLKKKEIRKNGEKRKRVLYVYMQIYVKITNTFINFEQN